MDGILVISYSYTGVSRRVVQSLCSHCVLSARTSMNLGSGGASNTVAEIAAILGKEPLIATALAQRELESGSGMTRLLAFGEVLQPRSIASQAALRPAWSPEHAHSVRAGAR